jgi:hypothetical protein
VFKNITWDCHICGKNRNDKCISVRKSPLIFRGEEIGSQNIRYCNDDTNCIEKSKTFSFIKNEVNKSI